MATMSESRSVENGMELAAWRGRSAGSEVVGEMVGVMMEPIVSISRKNKTFAFPLFLWLWA
jgi:hypothetical protein